MPNFKEIYACANCDRNERRGAHANRKIAFSADGIFGKCTFDIAIFHAEGEKLGERGQQTRDSALHRAVVDRGLVSVFPADADFGAVNAYAYSFQQAAQSFPRQRNVRLLL